MITQSIPLKLSILGLVIQLGVLNDTMLYSSPMILPVSTKKFQHEKNKSFTARHHGDAGSEPKGADSAAKLAVVSKQSC